MIDARSPRFPEGFLFDLYRAVMLMGIQEQVGAAVRLSHQRGVPKLSGP